MRRNKSKIQIHFHYNIFFLFSFLYHLPSIFPSFGEYLNLSRKENTIRSRLRSGNALRGKKEMKRRKESKVKNNTREGKEILEKSISLKKNYIKLNSGGWKAS